MYFQIFNNAVILDKHYPKRLSSIMALTVTDVIAIILLLSSSLHVSANEILLHVLKNVVPTA